MVYRFAAGLRTQSPRRLAAKYQFIGAKRRAPPEEVPFGYVALDTVDHTIAAVMMAIL